MKLSPCSPARAANPIEAVEADPEGDRFAADGRCVLLVETDGPQTITIRSQRKVDGEPVADKRISLAAGQRHLLGPFPRQLYGDRDGMVNLAYPDAEGIRLTLIRR